MSNTSGSLLVKAQCNSDNGVDREKMIECLVDNGYAPFSDKIVVAWGGKSRTGFATCVLYNDRFKNLSTKITSHYCHAIIGLDHSISIGVPAAGEITIGSAYEETSVRQTNIHY